MANRHLSRSIVLQTLFEWDFRLLKDKETLLVLERVAKEFAPGVGDMAFMENLLKGVLEKRETLDEIIVRAAPDWPMEKIAIVDRNVLRIGLYEMLFADRTQVPPKVSINEAIELAKNYGGDNSNRFVNGVLGAVYKEIGEPGKEEVSQKKKRSEEIEKLPVQNLGGAVVYSIDRGEIYLALVHDIFGHWTLSKGKLLPDEEVKNGVKRKVTEEIGLPIEIKETLGENEYVATDLTGERLRKHVYYFLAEAKHQDLVLGESGGLTAVRWFKIEELPRLNIYDDIMPIFTKAINLLKKEG